MPSSSSPESLAGAQELAESLAVRLLELPIAPVTAAFDEVLAEEFAGREPDITEENLQARAQGTLLMALSNKLGLLVLATGNKSEISVGYSTLYGDMVGGFAPSATSQDLGLPAGPLAQRVGVARGASRRPRSRGRRRRSCDPASSTRTAFLL